MKNAISILTLALVSFCLGCGPNPKNQVTQTKTQAVKETMAVVTFIRGEARMFRGDTWSPLCLGQELAADDSLDLLPDVQIELKHLEQSYRISGPASGFTATLIARATKPESGVGSRAISKVKKFKGNQQKFEAQTPTAVAGIRGVPAMVTADSIKKDTLPQ